MRSRILTLTLVSICPKIESDTEVGMTYYLRLDSKTSVWVFNCSKTPITLRQKTDSIWHNNGNNNILNGSERPVIARWLIAPYDDFQNPRSRNGGGDFWSLRTC